YSSERKFWFLTAGRRNDHTSWKCNCVPSICPIRWLDVGGYHLESVGEPGRRSSCLLLPAPLAMDGSIEWHGKSYVQLFDRPGRTVALLAGFLRIALLLLGNDHKILADGRNNQLLHSPR